MRCDHGPCNLQGDGTAAVLYRPFMKMPATLSNPGLALTRERRHCLDIRVKGLMVELNEAEAAAAAAWLEGAEPDVATIERLKAEVHQARAQRRIADLGVLMIERRVG